MESQTQLPITPDLIIQKLEELSRHVDLIIQENKLLDLQK
jgi:hypothetical protein